MSMCCPTPSDLPAFSLAIQARQAAGRIPVIAEIKASTPNAGDLLKGRAIASIARQYEAGGAACISVVTGKWFGGSPAMLVELARHTRLPILHKDFITNRRQIAQSRRDGAAAVLLTRALLRPAHLMDLADHAVSIGMTPFVEIAGMHMVRDLRLPPGAVIAVNNKDILGREGDPGNIGRSLALARACRATGAGLLASASGIGLPGQVRRLCDAGFDAFLIGTALLQSGDIRGCLGRLSVSRAKVA